MIASQYDGPIPSSDSDHSFEEDGDPLTDNSDDSSPVVTRHLRKQRAITSPLDVSAQTSHHRLDSDFEAAAYEKAVDTAPRLVSCGWQDCQAKLGCFALLRKHVERRHTVPSESVATTSRGSRPHPCHYGRCANRSFPTAKELLDHVSSAHLETVRLTCPIKGCRRQHRASPYLHRHLALDHHLLSNLQPHDTPASSQSQSASIPLAITLSKSSTRNPPLKRNIPTYSASLPLPKRHPIPTKPLHNAPRADTNSTTFDPFFMEFYEGDDGLGPRDKLVLFPGPRAAPTQRAGKTTSLSTRQLLLSPSKRKDGALSIFSSQQTDVTEDSAVEIITTQVRTARRVAGTVVHIPRRETPKATGPIVRWSTYVTPDLGEAAETSTTPAPSSTRASSIPASVHELGGIGRHLSSSVTPPSDRRHLSRILAAVVEERLNAVVAEAVVMEPAEHPSTIGFDALVRWHESMSRARAAGLDVENPFEQTSSKPTTRTSGKRKGKGKVGRPLKRARNV